ncbi:MAG: L,D-transpeptidase family protein [Victivallaceae bacterium]
MTVPGYNFNYGKSQRPGSDNGKMRRLLIFLVLTAIAVSAVFYFRAPPKQQVATPESETPAVVQTPVVTPALASASKSVPGLTQDVKTVAEKSLPADPVMEKFFSEAEALFNKSEFVAARDICDKILESGKVTEGSALWINTVDLQGKTNIKIFMTDIPCPGKKEVYTVVANDSLEKVAKTYNTSIEAVQISNNIKPTNYNIWVGQTLKVYKGDWKILVSKSKKKLYLYDGDKLFKVYGIGTGKQDRTPVGTFVISSKIKNPPWYAPSGKIIPFGDKENVLGTRWLKLQPVGETSKSLQGFGIHGTWAPDSIGQSLSNGCVRMKNDMVEELFIIIPRLTPVTIVE